MDVEEIKETTIRDLQSIIEGIRNIRLQGMLSYSFNTKEIQDPQFVDKLLNKIQKDIDHSKFKYIYTFFLVGNFPISSAYEIYNNAKSEKKAGRAYARLNEESYCLYVGSSNDLVHRIKQHMGFGPKGTFAMQLCHWCEHAALDVNLRIYAFANSISSDAFQTFEDGVWNSLKPMLGRQGKR
jgi:hypothetical protein